tara:strand:- start:451 stop:693 length:243 start_codon:yes stop_codon:yes gene_type:complete
MGSRFNYFSYLFHPQIDLGITCELWKIFRDSYEMICFVKHLKRLVVLKKSGDFLRTLMLRVSLLSPGVLRGVHLVAKTNK